MAIDLGDYEKGARVDGDYDAQLADLQERLARVQVALIVHRRRAIIVLEGWDAAGKGGIIKRLTAEWDPRNYEVWPIAAPTDEEKKRHFLWRFWRRLPGDGEIAVFDRSWYGRVLVERVEGYATTKQWHRAYDEINEFEAQQKDDGTTIIKLFVHVTQETQDERLRKRLSDPWKRWKITADDFRNRARRADYLAAMAEMFEQTDTRWAPWQPIDGTNKKYARIAALTHVVERLEKAVPTTPPPADEAVVAVAREAMGKDVEIG
ncbi:polyphosphate kinase 2 family protein [Sphingomonas solaris]|uniref:Polyphosphate kinase n=1 Tax=Alterirhizorhabdus solaris TaxID=2529389 RepID=A0A558QTY2_9SPHN|nr:polyphosphate kinase [Sphingomonas solaris]TVV70600.1 polyphosphate kinase [Sphingomonas solaris]